MSVYEFLFNLVHVDPLLCVTMALVVVAVVLAIAAYRRSGKRRDEALILQCMTHYNDVRRVKANAIMTGSQSLAEVYYANLFDLMWVEFKLWLEGRVNNAMMLEWMSARYADFSQNDGILVSRQGPAGRSARRVSYPEEWAKRVRSAGTSARRPAFFEFMDLTHEGQLQKAIGGRRRFRKNSSKPAPVKAETVAAADSKKQYAPQSPVAEPAGVVMGSAAGMPGMAQGAEVAQAPGSAAGSAAGMQSTGPAAGMQTVGSAGMQTAGSAGMQASGSAEAMHPAGPAAMAPGPAAVAAPGFMQDVVVQVPTQESAGPAAPGTIYVAPTPDAGGAASPAPGAVVEVRGQDRAG